MRFDLEQSPIVATKELFFVVAVAVIAVAVFTACIHLLLRDKRRAS